MAKAFLNLIDSFNLVQHVSGPTQEHGHTLELVLLYGLPVLNLDICDTVISDHMPVLFEVALACNRPTVKAAAAARSCRVINLSTAARISAAFNHKSFPIYHLNVIDHVPYIIIIIIINNIFIYYYYYKKYPTTPTGWYPDVTWSPSDADDVKNQLFLSSDDEEGASDHGDADMVAW